MLSRTFLDFFFQYYHKAQKNIAYSIENSLRQPAAKFCPQKGANLKSKKAHCETDLNAPWLYPKQMSTKVNLHLSGQSTLELSIDTFVLN